MDELNVAYLRAAPALCHLCGKERLAGVLFFFCCGVLAFATKICDFCGCLTPSLQFVNPAVALVGPCPCAAPRIRRRGLPGH